MTTWRRAVCVVWAAFAMALSGFGPAVAQVPTLDAANQLLDYGQRQFAQYFPGSPATQRLDPWIYRYYAATGIYLGVYDGPADPLGVYVLGGPFGSEPLRVGRVSDFITPGASIVPTPGRVSAGWYHTLAVGADGGVLAWGSPTWIAAAGTAVAGSAARRISGVPAAAAVEAGASVLAVATVLGRDLSATQWEVLAPIPRGLPAAVGALRLTQCDGAPGTVFVLAASGSVLLGSGAPVAGLDGAADIREDSYAGSGRCLLTVVKRDGTLWRADLVVGAGRIVSSTVLQVTGLPAVAQASCSRDGNNGELCLALSTAGEVYTWGSSNRYGQMASARKARPDACCRAACRGSRASCACWPATARCTDGASSRSSCRGRHPRPLAGCPGAWSTSRPRSTTWWRCSRTAASGVGATTARDSSATAAPATPGSCRCGRWASR